jgi:tetratricopeptide (TPR) repeat protein
MNQVFATFLERLPGAVAILGIALFSIYMFKEYKAVRRENAESVKNYVNMVIGDMAASLQAQLARLEGISTKQEMRLKEIDKLYIMFNNDLSNKLQEVSKSYSEVEMKFGQLKAAIPSVDEFSARDIYGLAQMQDDPRTRAELCAKILNHPDSRSSDLEMAGDMMRQSFRNSLALALYKKACELDPERRTAKIELLALQAELDPKIRDESLANAIDLVLKSPDANGFARITNALIEIDRYQELLDFSTDFQQLVAGRDKDLNAIALRNIAVAHKQLGNIDKSVDAYKEALMIHPNDENILKPYLGILEKQEDYGEYLEVASRLIQLDPSDASYYLLYVGALVGAKRYTDADEWIKRAKALIQNPTDEAAIRQYERKVAAAARFAAEVES